MSIANLDVSGSLPGTLSLVFRADGKSSHHVETQIIENLENIVDASPSTLQELLVEPIWRNIRQWVLDAPEEGILAISSESAALDLIPWERCLATLLPSAVVRLVRDQRPVSTLTSSRLRLLAAGWPNVPGIKLPAIASELGSLAELTSKQGITVRVLTDPTVEEFQEVCTSFKPNILHLIPPAVRSQLDSSPEFLLTLDGQHHWVDVLALVPSHGDDRQPCELVVINSCNSGGGELGSSALQVISNSINAAAFGWLGVIEDQAAADFSPFFYNRLLEGGSIVSALCSYGNTRRAINKNTTQWPTAKGMFATRDIAFLSEESHPVVPVLWSPNLELLTRPLYTPFSELPQIMRGDGIPRDSEFTGEDETADQKIPHIEIIFEPMRFLNPALLKNGSPAIPRLVLDAREAQEAVSLVIHCDTGLGTSTVRQTLNLEKGLQPFPPIDRMQFPVLYELIDGSVARRQINFTVTCSCKGQVISEKTESVLWMGCSEWLDKPETWAYIPAFVNPYEDGVLDVLDRADEVLKSLGNATSSFSGYQTGDSDFVIRQVEAIFKALRDQPFELRYINPPPIPVFEPMAELASGQRVRTPTEVIARKRGTCHDLAILVASCLEHIGIYPLVILISGHTFVGFWTSSQKHFTYWRKVQKNLLTTPAVGVLWTINKREELLNLFKQGEIQLLEATRVTDRNADFDQALQRGYKNINNLTSSRKLDAAIDIRASRRQIQPL